jgi:anthranilate phosphoribosyltransferase
MIEVMNQIMSGECTPAQIGAFITALRMKGETVEEITGAARVMRERATPIRVGRGVLDIDRDDINIDRETILDVVGTGGDGTNTFNVSTTVSFVVSACGVKVAKHGNRSVSSKSGSADVLEAAGVNLDVTPEQVARCIEQAGVGFMFAPRHHGAMKHAIGPRREMGVRTIFNILGPLTNPAGAPNQVLGVFSMTLLEPLAQVLQRLGSRHVLVVHAEDGMDEISIGAVTHVAELKDGTVRTYSIWPEQFGLQRTDIKALAVTSPQESLNMMRAVLDNTSGPALDIVLLNAGAAIYVAGLASSLDEGVQQARAVIENGSARARLASLIAASRRPATGG